MTANRTWANMSKKEQVDRMMNMRLHIPMKIKSSSLEYRIKKILDNNKIDYIHQFFLSHYSYDFCFKNYHILEVQGDYWHASPRIYNRGDLINYGKSILLAEEIWTRDWLKAQEAEKYGNKVHYIWESDMNSMTDDEIFSFIIRINK